jgi:hypothetical protein
VRRAVLAAAAGVALGILVDWRLGLTVAVAVAVVDTVHRSRTTAVIPAAIRVTSAQRRTRRRLRRLRRAGYRTLNARALPGTSCVVDHLVIGPAGVFAVDSERWDRRLPLRATQGGQLFHGPYGQTSRWTCSAADGCAATCARRPGPTARAGSATRTSSRSTRRRPGPCPRPARRGRR